MSLPPYHGRNARDYGSERIRGNATHAQQCRVLSAFSETNLKHNVPSTELFLLLLRAPVSRPLPLLRALVPRASSPVVPLPLLRALVPPLLPLLRALVPRALVPPCTRGSGQDGS